MSTTAIPRSTAPRPATPPPIPVVPPALPRSQPADELPSDERNVWERTITLLCTSFGVSLLLHLCVLSMLAFWIFRTPMPEILLIDSGVYDAKKISELDTQEVKVAPPSVPKDDVSPLKSHAAVLAASNGSPTVKFDIPVPDIPGPGMGTTGGDGKGIFGSGTAAKSYVFVVDCSGSMQGARFTRAVSELVQTLGRLKSTQRFYIVFYSDGTMPMFSKPALLNSKDAGPNAEGFAVRGRFGRMNRFGKRMGGRGAQPRRRRPVTVRHRLLSATVANRERAKRWIFTIQPGGGTLPAEALEIALAMKPQVVYFLTDGEIPEDTALIVRQANKSKVVVHTVALGYEGSADILKEIARENNGRYKFVQ